MRRKQTKIIETKMTAMQELGLVLRAKFSGAEITERTKFSGMQTHALCNGQLPLSIEDLEHIAERLNIDVKPYMSEVSDGEET